MKVSSNESIKVELAFGERLDVSAVKLTDVLVTSSFIGDSQISSICSGMPDLSLLGLIEDAGAASACFSTG